MPELLEIITLSDQNQDDVLMTEALMRDGTTAQVELDKLAEFWANNKDNIQTQKFTPRGKRRTA
jgi:hypothetical protein